MGIGSIVLGAFAFICMIGGVVLGWVPFLGTMLSFLAPLLALVGIILGGVALSRSRSGGGESEGLAIGGLVTSIVAFIPAMLVALTCGVCNVCTTAMYLDPSIGAYDAGPADGGAGVHNGSVTPIIPPPVISPPPFPASAPTPGLTPLAPTPTPSTDPLSPPPSSAMPPPPLPPGPGTG